MKTQMEDLKLKQVLYFMQSFVLTVAGTDYDIPRTMIGTIQISKLFDEAVYPLCYINVMVPIWLYQKITKTPDDIKLSMDLQYAMADDVDSILYGEAVLKSDIKGNFKVVVPYTTQLGDYSHQAEIAREDGTLNTGYTANEGAMVEMSIYEEDAYNAAYNTLSGILPNATPLEILKYIINSSKLKNPLISKPDNTTAYGQFSIIPQSSVKNLVRLSDEFKFHNDGSVVFLDLDTTYFITKKPGCYVWRNNEHKTVYLLTLAAFTESMERFSGIHIDSKNKETIIAVPTEAFESISLDGNPLFRSQSHQFVKFQVRNALVSVFSPNKEFVFTVDDLASNTYNGKYHLHSVEIDFIPRGEFLDPAFTVTLIK